MKAALIPNMEKQGVTEITKQTIEVLKAAKISVAMPINGFNTEVMSEENLFKTADIIITVGGDGTIIRYAKNAAKFGKAVLGINAGRLGFLADVERNSLNDLAKLATGEYTVSERFMIKAEVYENGIKKCEGTALNDAVIASGGIARLLDLSLTVSGDRINYRSDGVIISTPTGSTAYSMSAGGPLIDPTVRCFSVTPICSHSLLARPMIVGEEKILALTLPESSKETAVFSLDGKLCAEVTNNVSVTISAAPYNAKLISISGNTIYKTLSLKI